MLSRLSLCAVFGVRGLPSHVGIDIGDILTAVERSGTLNSDRSAQCSEKETLWGESFTKQLGELGGGPRCPDSGSGFYRRR